MKNILFLLIFFLATTAYAGGGGGMTGGATLPEQLIQSGILNNQLGKQAQMVIQQATMIQKQVEQKNELLLLNRSLDPVIVNNLLNHNKQDMDSLGTYIVGLTQLSNASARAREAAVSRVLDLKNSGLSYEEYAAQERTLIDGGDRQRRQLAEHEKSLLENVNNDVLFVQEVQAKIPATVGAHESTQLLNTQMNRMVAQNATMIQLMAANNAVQKDNSLDEAQRREHLKRAVGTANAKEREWMRGEIERLNKPPTASAKPFAAPQPMTEAQKRALGF